jgi:hypothetical protein
VWTGLRTWWLGECVGTARRWLGVRTFSTAGKAPPSLFSSSLGTQLTFDVGDVGLSAISLGCWWHFPVVVDVATVPSSSFVAVSGCGGSWVAGFALTVYLVVVGRGRGGGLAPAMGTCPGVHPVMGGQCGGEHGKDVAGFATWR